VGCFSDLLIHAGYFAVVSLRIFPDVVLQHLFDFSRCTSTIAPRHALDFAFEINWQAHKKVCSSVGHLMSYLMKGLAMKGQSASAAEQKINPRLSGHLRTLFW
jgi:hypothetical protein